MKLFALGSNGSGQLGLGHNEDVSSPTEVYLPFLQTHGRLCKLAAGGNHTLLLFNDGSLHSFGEDVHSERLENSGKNLDPQTFRQIAATWDASVAVVEIDGGSTTGAHVRTHVNQQTKQRVITAGKQTKGELGRAEHNNNSIGTIADFPWHHSIVDIAACMNHVVAILSNGEVYGWGAGRKGQLGEPKQDMVDRPRKITGIPFHPHRVVCGKEFTYIVGPPFSGEHIVLGPDKWCVISDGPDRVSKWKDISASWGSIFVLLESEDVVSWGRNDHGQLCPPGLPKIRQLAAGSEHVAAVTSEGKVIAWGWGEHGNCGLPIDERGDVNGRWNELPVHGQVDFVGAGCATTFISTLPAGEEPTPSDD